MTIEEQEALLLTHMERCPRCCLITRDVCPIAEKIVAVMAMQAAAAMVPIPSIPRCKAKA